MRLEVVLHAQVARLQHRLQDGERAVRVRGRGRGRVRDRRGKGRVRVRVRVRARVRARAGLQDGELAVDGHEDGLQPVA